MANKKDEQAQDSNRADAGAQEQAAPARQGDVTVTLPAEMVQQQTSSSAAPLADGGASVVQARIDEAQAKGYMGTVPDPTPNENYTVEGSLRGAPTPETDPALAADAAQEAGLPLVPKKEGGQ